MSDLVFGVTDRRAFLKRLATVGAATIVGSSTGLLSRPMMAWAASDASDNTVIVNVFLRGGADGLSMFVPNGDDNYPTLRPNLGVEQVSTLALDDFFGLASSLTPLHSHFLEGRLAIVQGAGSPIVSRSHFEAQPILDTGVDSTGWLQRSLQAGDFDRSASGLTMGARVSPSLQGPWAGTVVQRIARTVANGLTLEPVIPTIRHMYSNPRFSLEKSIVADALLSIEQVSMVDPANSGAYPNNGLAKNLQEAAALIKADIGVRGVAIDDGGWDTHANQTVRLEALSTQLAGALDAFQNDLGDASNRVVTVVMSEFGRTAAENGAGGTDHGHGNFMMVMGEMLTEGGGGQVHGTWPGLGGAELQDQRDLKVTTDFRTVLSELIDRHLDVDPTVVFNGYNDDYLGLLAPPLPGDTNRSGTVDAEDVQLVLDDITGSAPDDYFSAAGDLDDDGDTDLLDALLIDKSRTD